MAQNKNIGDALSKLGLGRLPQNWIEGVWDDNFVDTSESWPIDEINPADAIESLSSIIAAIDIDDRSPSDIWSSLKQQDNNSIRALIPVLHYYMDSSSEKPEAAALASTVYCMLLNLDGSEAHSTFSPMVFRSVIKVLGCWTGKKEESVGAGSKRKATSPPPSQPTKRRPTTQGSDDSAVNTQSTAPIHVMLPLMRSFINVIRDLRHTGVYDCAEDIVILLIAITRTEWPNSKASKEKKDFSERLSKALKDPSPSADPALLAFAGLESLCSGQATELLVFKALIDSVTMRSRGVISSNSTIPRVIHRIRNDSTSFVEHLLKQGKCKVGARLLIQHTCTKVPDRAEYRSSVAESVADMIYAFHASIKGEYDMFAWLAKYSRNPRAGYRHFSVEILASIIEYINGEPPAEIDPMLDHDDNANSSVKPTAAYLKYLVRLLLDRCSDKATTVRARALSTLAKIVNARPNDPLKTDLPFDSVFLIYIKGLSNDALQQTLRFGATASPTTSGPNTKANTPNVNHSAPATPGAGSNNFLKTLERRAADEKGLVRKAAVQLLSAITLRKDWVALPFFAQQLAKLCSDTALAVRKEALVAITDILEENQTNNQIQSIWLNAVLPLVLDSEDSVRTKCVEILESFILGPVTSPSDCQLGWDLLAAIDQRQDMRRYLQRVCSHWDRAGMLKSKLYKTLTAHVCNPSTSGGWSLLSEMAACHPEWIDSDAISNAWTNRNLDDLMVTSNISSTLAHVASRLDQPVRERLTDELRATLFEFTVPVSIVSGTIDCLIKIETVGASSLGASGLASKTKSFFTKLTKECETRIATVALNKSGKTVYDEVTVARLIFTFGEIALVCPELVTARHVLIIQALLTPNLAALAGAANASFSSESSDTTKDNHPAAVRAHAFLTLGKLCLQDEELAKSTIASMARELDTCSDPAVRNNIVFIMTDLCVRHPNFIQQYLPCIANRLRDSNALVRRQTITLITRLLKEDYVKLRHGLFFRLILTAVDDDLSVQELGRFCVSSILHVKDASVCAAHFVECLFHFNANTNHQIYNRFPQSEQQLELFAIHGPSNTWKRRELYKMMLGLCTDMDRLNLSQRICQDILGALSEGSLPLSDAMKPVLQDALSVLASPEIKFESKSSKDVDEDDARVAAAAKAKATMISKLVKKNTAENIVPIIIALKGKLQQTHSPLLKDLMMYLRELVKDYKDEISDIMVADKQLGNEIKYDLEKFEEAEQRELQLSQLSKSKKRSSIASIASVAGTPLRRGISPLMSPIALNAFGTPGTPKFASPKLRNDTMKRGRTSMSNLSMMQQPSDILITPMKSTPSSAKNTPALQADTPSNLAWVRTPASKTRAASLQESDYGSNPLIVLPAPVEKEAEKWSVKPPEFKETSNEKRIRDEFETDDLLDENDENTNVTNIESTPPTKRQQLSKAQIRKHRFELSKLTVVLHENNTKLEELVAQEKYFEAEELKRQIASIHAQRSELQALVM